MGLITRAVMTPKKRILHIIKYGHLLTAGKIERPVLEQHNYGGLDYGR